MDPPEATDIGDEGLVDSEAPTTIPVKPITSLSEYYKVIRDSKVVVVYLYTKYCGYCKYMAPVIENAAGSGEFRDVAFYKVDCGDEQLEDVSYKELFSNGVPAVFVFRLGLVFRVLGGYTPDFEPWLTSTVSAINEAVEGAAISHPDLLEGESPTITQIKSLKQFNKITGSARQPTILYIHSNGSPESERISSLFECGAVADEVGTARYCILDSDKHPEVVKKIGLDMVTGVVGFYAGKMLGWSQGQTWGDIGSWLDDFRNAIQIAQTAFAKGLGRSSKKNVVPITEITSVTQLHEMARAHNRVIVNFYNNKLPISRAVSLVFERVAADSEFEEIPFVKVDVTEQEEVACSLEASAGEIKIFFISEEEEVSETEIRVTFDELKEDILEHINPEPSDEDTDDDADSSDEEESNDEDGEAEETEQPPEPSEERPEVETPVSASDEVEIPVSPQTRNSEESNGIPAIPVIVSSESDQRTVSTISLDSQASTSTFIADRHACEGDHQIRGHRPFYKRPFQPRPFADYEKGCVFSPASKDDRLQIGTANESDSRFSIALSCDTHRTGEVTIHFLISFVADPTIGARFESAAFEVDFYQHDDNGNPSFLNIRDFEPKDQRGEATEVQVGKGLEASMGIKAASSLVSLMTSATSSTTEQYTKRTASRVRGACTNTSTVMWTFVEDEGEAGRTGLEATYAFHACVPNAKFTSIQFWAKAMLVRARRPKVALRMGSKESPYEKLLDLRSLYPKET